MFLIVAITHSQSSPFGSSPIPGSTGSQQVDSMSASWSNFRVVSNNYKLSGIDELID
jgi:hypothetical protein